MRYINKRKKIDKIILKNIFSTVTILKFLKKFLKFFVKKYLVRKKTKEEVNKNDIVVIKSIFVEGNISNRFSENLIGNAITQKKKT